jgi:hypothetical protein
MKTTTLFILFIFNSFFLFAQPDSTSRFILHTEEMLTNTEDSTATESEVSEEEVPVNEMRTKSESDTVHLRFGNHAVEITTDDNNNTHIDVEKIEDFSSKWESKDRDWNKDWKNDRIETVHHKNNKKFDGHWSGVDFGGNLLLNTNYSMYPVGTPNFIETSPEKSFEVNLNLIEYSFGFSSYIGLVTGLGLNFNDYKFKNRYTLTKDEAGILQPDELPEGDFRLSKLSTTFITAPLLLEFQIPGQWDHDRMFITAGVIGGIKIHEHTKTKIGDEKKRDNGNHNVAPLRWGYTARIGFENMGIFATYYNTKLFEKGTGPETTPVTIGLTLLF